MIRISDQRIDISLREKEILKNLEKTINLPINIELFLPKNNTFSELIWSKISPETEEQWKKIMDRIDQ